MNKAVFLDRDGVINHDYAYVSKIEDFEFIDGVFDACQQFIKQGFMIIVVTNQSGIGRGYYSEQDFNVLTDWMKSEFNKHQIPITEVYFCPHHPKNALPEYLKECDCRKPMPGMLNQAIERFDIDVSKSIMVGDKISDLQAAQAAGIKTKILVKSGKAVTDEGKEIADEVWQSLSIR
jgi:D-glycero-D-manno-heptose 1,7-bisphosphate phosphatase